MNNCLECCNKYLDTTDGTDIVYVCSITGKVLSDYSYSPFLEFLSCLCFKSYSYMGIKFKTEKINFHEDLPF